MLQKLVIKNYALIRSLDISPSEHLNIITGETGAGKSIMLGAVGLLMGNRADTRVLMDADNKCIVEGFFDISEYKLKDFFESEDLDYENPAVIRREISRTGKSRAFINDTPVTLNILKDLGEFLMDIHSQNDTVQLSSSSYQLGIIDKYAGLEDEQESYFKSYEKFKEAQTKLRKLKEEESKIHQEHDYYRFLFDELIKADLKENETEELESELKLLENAEEIKTALHGSIILIQEQEYNIQDQLKEIISTIGRIKNLSEDYSGLFERFESLMIELNDLGNEISRAEESIEFDPERQEEVSGRLSLIYQLLQKHQVGSIDELLKIQQDIESKVSRYDSMDEEIDNAAKQMDLAFQEANQKAISLSENRRKYFKEFSAEIEQVLSELAIPNAKVSIAHEETDLSIFGIDDIDILFSANKGVEPAPLSEVASGGEFSRFMFSLKFILAARTSLPTIIFDEIDTGVSGEVAIKLGNMMKKMSANHQVISISHLPQIAAKADTHYIVFKDDSLEQSQSDIRLLNDEERVTEIAKMIAGDDPSPTAFENARELISQA